MQTWQQKLPCWRADSALPPPPTCRVYANLRPLSTSAAIEAACKRVASELNLRVGFCGVGLSAHHRQSRCEPVCAGLHPGASWPCVVLERQNKIAPGRDGSTRFLNAWKHADQDLSLLLQAGMNSIASQISARVPRRIPDDPCSCPSTESDFSYLQNRALPIPLTA